MIKKHVQEYERAIREGFWAGLAVALKSQQLYRGYDKKRLQRLAGGISDLVNFKPFGKEINFKYIVDEMKEKYGVDLTKIDLVVKVKPAGKGE